MGLAKNEESEGASIIILLQRLPEGRIQTVDTGVAKISKQLYIWSFL